MAYLEFPLQFKRQFAAPLDIDQKFSTTAERTAYLSSALCTTGLTAYDAETDNMYYVSSTGWKEIGSSNEPLFLASASYTITSTDISNWNTAYGWGNHSTQGYLTLLSLTGYATESWVEGKGYLTSYDESDPTVASYIKSIKSSDITNWNAAYTAYTSNSYVLRTEMGVASGVATLGIDGKVPNSQLPALLAVNNTYVVSSEALMLATGASVGDVAVRTDLSETYILQSTPASTLANWVQLLFPTSTVGSVNGMTGTVVFTAVAPIVISSGVFSITQATTSTNGYLSSTDWNTFNNKEASLGNPSTDGMVLSSTSAGSRSWISLPSTYTLPAATNSTLGGVKVGSNINVSVDGSISIDNYEPSLGNPVVNGYVLSSTSAGVRSWVASSSYSLPIATLTTLGGIKVGNNLTIDIDGTLNASTGSVSNEEVFGVYHYYRTTLGVDTAGDIRVQYTISGRYTEQFDGSTWNVKEKILW